MFTYDHDSGATRSWLRLATGLALGGVVALASGGLVLVTEDGANAAPAPGQDKIGICHRTASETNPYVYLRVPADEANGHITGTGSQHNQQVTWDSDGTWRGVAHAAGDLRLDYYASAEEIAAGNCFDTTVPTEEPTTPPTEEPTEPPTEEPTAPPTEPAEPTEPPTEEPAAPPTEPAEPTEPTDGTGVDSNNVENRQAESPSDTVDARDDATTVVPRRIDAGVGASDTATNWASGLIGGGSALLVSSGGVALGARRFDGQ